MRIQDGVSRAGITAAVRPPRARSALIVDYGGGEAGLYVTGVVNAFWTSLAARGTRAELEAFLAEARR